jgi:hypothetical protein
MAERRPSVGSSALNQVDKNYKYGGDSAIGALLLPERREILRDKQNQFIGYDDQGNAIVETIPAQYGESEVDFSYSPIVRGAKATGSFLNDIFFGDANEQSEAAGRADSAVRGIVGGLGDYASSQYEAGMAGGTIYDPETRQITEFDPALVMGGSGAGKSLPRSALNMSDAARMQRAQELGFDTERTAYRGLSGEYDPNKAGNYQMFTSSPEDAGEYGSNVVSSYLRKGNNLVVEGGRNNFNSIPVRNLPDAVRANLHSSVGSVARTDDIAYAAQAAGYDSVSINNVFDKASNEIPIKPLPAKNEPMSQEMMDFLDEVYASEEYKAYQMLNNTPDVALPPEIPKNYDPTTIDIIFDPKNIRSINAEFDPTKADSADLLSSRQSERQMSALRGIA